MTTADDLKVLAGTLPLSSEWVDAFARKQAKVIIASIKQEVQGLKMCPMSGAFDLDWSCTKEMLPRIVAHVNNAVCERGYIFTGSTGDSSYRISWTLTSVELKKLEAKAASDVATKSGGA